MTDNPEAEYRFLILAFLNPQVGINLDSVRAERSLNKNRVQFVITHKTINHQRSNHRVEPTGGILAAKVDRWHPEVGFASEE
jgi:hypothetical protein